MRTCMEIARHCNFQGSSGSSGKGYLQPGELLQNKYQIKRELGEGSNGITYEAEVVSEGPEKGSLVAVKALSLVKSRDWKAVELFERESRVLATLKHPSIPAYLDYFEVDSEEDRVFYLVQCIAPGTTLEAMVESGWRPTEAEAVRIAVELLNIIAYLESLRPPVVHRDIKPQNILIDGEGGGVSLVDFGAVAPTALGGGSTIVGTY
eukprot:gene17548-20896_t